MTEAVGVDVATAGVGVGEDVLVGVDAGVRVLVGVSVAVDVDDGVAVGRGGVAAVVAVLVGVNVRATVAVAVEEDVGVAVPEGVAVGVAVNEGVAVAVPEGVAVGVAVNEGVAVAVPEGVAVAVAHASDGAEPLSCRSSTKACALAGPSSRFSTSTTRKLVALQGIGASSETSTWVYRPPVPERGIDAWLNRPGSFQAISIQKLSTFGSSSHT